MNRLEVNGEAIGYTHHEGRDGWGFSPLWEPGMGSEKLQLVVDKLRAEGAEARSKEIGRLLGVAQ